MYKLQKAILIIFILLILDFDISLLVDELYHYTLDRSLFFVVIAFIPLVISLIYYFITTRYQEKLSINYIFLSISLISFSLLLLCKALYYSLIIDEIYEFSVLLYIPYILFTVLAFLDNFHGNQKYAWHFCLVVPILLILQFCLSFEYIFYSVIGHYYTNPNRYEFVKYHYFSDEEFAYLPNKIPEDATNVNFYFEPNNSFSNTISLYLEYDSQTVDNDNHHAKYEIITSLKGKNK